jgi:hypothetical protein
MATNPRGTRNRLLAPEPPNLPLAHSQYEQIQQDKFSNVLRLYFNRLSNFLAALSSNNGGATLQFPHGAFHQDGITYLTAPMTNVSTTAIQVISTAEFVNSAGTLLIVDELVDYTGKTATTFTGITRGTYGSTKSAHAIGDVITEAQGVVSATTALAVKMSATDASEGITVDTVDPSKIYCDVSGYYNVQFSAQMINWTTDNDNVSFWFRINGLDVPYSAGVQQILPKHGTFPGAAIVSWNIIIPLSRGDYFQLYYATSTGNTVLCTRAPGTITVAPPVTPISPAVILTAVFVSALYT